MSVRVDRVRIEGVLPLPVAAGNGANGRVAAGNGGNGRVGAGNGGNGRVGAGGCRPRRRQGRRAAR
ncbi:hypothetical protein, partial [Microbacterium lacticum]|uniref:hypothetical protein n=1 Tax=Microbacterium lacticum TaxID=33885 RepID=UPI00242A9967